MMAAELQTLDQASAQNASQEGSTSYGDARSRLVTLSVQTPPAPSAFKGIPTGPEIALEWEAQQTDQVELSDSLLRNLSPFIIQIEPPAVFADLLAPSEQASGVPQLDLYGTANGGLATYAVAREALVASSLYGGLMGQGTGSVESVEEFAVRSYGSETLASGEDIPVGSPVQEDWLAAADTIRQIVAILDAPPLVLLINPTSLRLATNKVQQFQDRTRYGYILHTWGDDQLKVSITATCGAFVSGGRGVSAASKRDSLAWQNMMNLVHFYRHNGYIYDTIGKSNANLHVGALSIRYDNWIYYGNMESLNFTFDETKNLGGIEFSMEFTANRKLDVDQQWFNVLPMKSPIPSLSDPRYQGENSRGSGQLGHWQWDIGENRVERSSASESVDAGTESSGFLASAGNVEGVVQQPTGLGGLQDTGVVVEERPVTQVTPNFSAPFGNRNGVMVPPTSSNGV